MSHAKIDTIQKKISRIDSISHEEWVKINKTKVSHHSKIEFSGVT